ncbi:MAG: PEP-CTERM sorting domain-containing protein [Candidatus Omnitrophica bacterium]|nr:PEP-CTERM sorting domain-containing protein [Candidatus Omnitrophota bacterium]MCA9447690.1 PEP-CTERM sorting domain-containing protein [Candidatus Omnitrophota bacterium]
MKLRIPRVALLIALGVAPLSSNAVSIGDAVGGSFWTPGFEGSNFFNSNSEVVRSGAEFFGTGPDPLADYVVKANFDNFRLTMSMTDLRTGPESYTVAGMSGDYHFNFWGLDFLGYPNRRIVGVDIDSPFPNGVIIENLAFGSHSLSFVLPQQVLEGGTESFVTLTVRTEDGHVPEPMSIILFGFGTAGLIVNRRRTI